MLFNKFSVQAALFSTMVVSTGALESQKTREHGDESSSFVSFVPGSLQGEHQPYVDIDKQGMMESLYPESIPKKPTLTSKTESENPRRLHNSTFHHGTKVDDELPDFGIFTARTQREDTGVDADGRFNGYYGYNEYYPYSNCDEGTFPIEFSLQLNQGSPNNLYFSIYDQYGNDIASSSPYFCSSIPTMNPTKTPYPTYGPTTIEPSALGPTSGSTGYPTLLPTELMSGPALSTLIIVAA